MKLFVLALSTLGLLCAASLPTSAQTCSIRSISVPGASVTLGYGVNKYDTVVGSYAIGTSQNFHAYRWSNGNFSSYMYPNAVSTEFRRNNDSGVIVGTYKTSAGRNHGFELANGQTVSFDYPGAYNTFATGINNSGTIVGYFTTSATGAAAGFRKTSGGWTALRFPNAKATFAWAVSDTGEIVGTYLDVSGHLQGFDGGLAAQGLNVQRLQLAEREHHQPRWTQ